MTTANELQETSAQRNLCILILEVIGKRLPEGMMAETLWIRRKASKLIVQRGLHTYKLLTIRRLPGSRVSTLHIFCRH